jgi:hypothetical protein
MPYKTTECDGDSQKVLRFENNLLEIPKRIEETTAT